VADAAHIPPVMLHTRPAIFSLPSGDDLMETQVRFRFLKNWNLGIILASI
jgi:hypothetical protein